MNRLTRDQVLHRALDMVSSPALDVKDRPNGVIVGEALSVGWLQDGLDMFHNVFPWQTRISTQALTLTASQNDQGAVPADFVLDVRNGLVIATLYRRLGRTSLQKFISFTAGASSNGAPRLYVIYQSKIFVHPKPDLAYSATLWYYSLPAILGPDDVPSFPSDWLLIDYVTLRGREWLKLVPPGTAMAFARAEMGELRKAGLNGEPEDDELPLDATRFTTGAYDPNSWMGSGAVNPQY